MGIIVSAFSSTPRDFPDAAHAAIDAASFPLSQANWRGQLLEMFLRQVDEEALTLEELASETKHYLSYHDGKTGLGEDIAWHIGLRESWST